MLIRRVSLMAFLLFGCLTVIGNRPAIGKADDQAQDDKVMPALSLAPPFIFPNKEVFTVREDEQLVVLVNAACLSGDEANTEFKLLTPTPNFVRISEVYRQENKDYVASMAVLYITPKDGDAGNYDVTVSAKACGGRVERPLTFKLKVKRVRQGQ